MKQFNLETQSWEEKAEPPTQDAYEYLRAIYRGEIEADPWRVRAAKECLQYERPKLAVTSLVIDGSFADRLDRAVARSKEPNRMNRVIEHQPIEEEQ